MDCKEFREILDLYVDEELSPEALADAQIHLADCHACRRAENTLLNLRSNLKLTVSQHQPPPDLVKTVQRITESRWREHLGSLTRMTDDHTQGSGRSWGGGIRLSAPVFALLLLATLTFGILFMAEVFKPAKSVRKVATTVNSERGRSAGAADDFARFDHGGRAILYKQPR